jgi:hypothetical protein
MKLRSLAVFLSLALAAAAAHAQAGVYLTFDAQQFDQSGIYANPGTHSNVDRPWIFGPGYGVYYNFKKVPGLSAAHTGPLVFGLDAHGDTLRVSEYNSQLDRQDGIISVRLSLKKPVDHMNPYFEGGFGIGHTKVPFAQAYSNNLIYQFGAGIDHKIKGRLDWRVIDASAGFLSNYIVGAGPNQSNFMITLGTGLVFRSH